MAAPAVAKSIDGLQAPHGGKLYLFGGWSQATLLFFNDLYALDPATLAWEDLTSAVGGDVPPPVSGHVFAALGPRLYVFGGAILAEGSVGAARDPPPARRPRRRASHGVAALLAATLVEHDPVDTIALSCS